MIEIWPQLGAIDSATMERIETEAKYAVYLERQGHAAAQIRAEESRRIPEGLEFAGVPGLSNELKLKLANRKPRSIGEAQRIDGMTPAALAILLTQIRNHEASASEAA